MTIPNSICHFEIGCRDEAKTKEFFSQLFDWKMEQVGPATMIRTGGDVGGHITALGGKMVVPPVAIPGGIFVWFADPEGNTIGLFQEQTLSPK
jgi:predicted enzyme related to lactoylglutathione lyase